MLPSPSTRAVISSEVIRVVFAPVAARRSARAAIRMALTFPVQAAIVTGSVPASRAARYRARRWSQSAMVLRASAIRVYRTVSCRSSWDGANAEVWSADGRQEHVGDLGDAIEGVLTTATGEIWVGYFDEAMGGSGPQGHGLARFSSDLQPVWLYPGPPTTPEIFDCYALNVAGETAWTCAYTQFHVVSACGDQVTDLGRAPYRSAHLLLVDGGTGALIGGPGPEYDLVTSFRITEGQTVASGSQQRLVLPDGMELRGFRSACRGSDLHVIIRGAWYRTDLDQLTDGAE